MSEYQYYEFQALDRRLTEKEMDELRRISTRAEITSTSLTNEYHWGDFKGNPNKLMEKYFDLFFYFANWGTNRLMLRLPKATVDTEELKEFTNSEFLSHEVHKNSVVLDFRSEDESGEWIEDCDFSAGSMGRVRDELLAGDKRALYLGWLAAVCQDYSDVEDDDLEPPLPPGLTDLSPALTEMVAFLRVDNDLLAVAAEWSQPLISQQADPKDLKKWLSTIPPAQKDAWLSRTLRGEEFGLRAEMLREFQLSQKAHDAADAERGHLARRTAGELRQAADAHRQKREQEYAAAQERERLRREKEAATAQAKRLAALSGKEEAAWKKVETLVASADYENFDKAVELLSDLRLLALKNHQHLSFSDKVQEIRKHHAKKRALLSRLKKASLY